MSLKAGTQRALLKLGVYHRLKESPVYDIYWKVVNARIVRQRDQEFEFYPHPNTTLPSYNDFRFVLDYKLVDEPDDKDHWRRLKVNPAHPKTGPQRGCSGEQPCVYANFMKFDPRL